MHLQYTVYPIYLFKNRKLDRFQEWLGLKSSNLEKKCIHTARITALYRGQKVKGQGHVAT